MPVLDLSAYKPVPATLGDANQIANGMQAIVNCINALDNNNFAAGKIFDPAKLMQNAAVDRQGMAWDAGSSTWKPIGGPVYRKNTAKVVVNTVAETDLLNGEITVAALLGANGMLRLTAFGDWKQNSGASTDVPRFKLKLGATTLIDTNGVGVAVVGTNPIRIGWRLVAEIVNLGATNAQWVSFEGRIMYISSAVFGAAVFATGEGITQTVLNSGTSADMTHMLGGSSSAVDTTAAQALVLSVINPAANANLDVTLKAALVEVL